MRKFPVKYRVKEDIKHRSDILTLLSEACEIEHGLACSYLYSAFSLKSHTLENITAEQLQYVRKWASQIFFIASQEMLHLSQAWNLLKAIGGTPYYFRPNFPQSSKYYPFHIPLKLEPFSFEALHRFLLYELPTVIDEKEYLRHHVFFHSEDNYSYHTVGELYELIEQGFKSIDEKTLFIGNHNLQTGSDEIDFKEIIRVTDRESAIAAIRMITSQGEGTSNDTEDCHFGIFKKIDSDYKSLVDADPNFQPARNTISNPIVFNKGNYSSDEGEIIINELTKQLADIFDDIYDLMLKTLQHCFANTNNDKVFNKVMAGVGIQTMVRVIKPLGEQLTTLPAFNDSHLKKAGPAFGLSRHISLPNENNLAKKLIVERGNEILLRLNDKTFDSIDLSFKNNFSEIIGELTHPIRKHASQ